MVLVRGQGVTQFDIERSLSGNTNVTSFSLNQLITGQDSTPNDTDFVRGAMPSLTDIGMPAAWDVSIGSLRTVVGVLDTGIDLAHRDLYLNIWFNQGEIPAHFLDDVGNKLTDIDRDGLITFYDLNNVTRSRTEPYSLIFGGIDTGPNAEFVTDFNGNGYIDGLDILSDPLWADGRDTDGNSEVDDFFGVNFRGGIDRNNPTDGQGHGTHIAGTIGAIGGNGTGVTGVNWQTSLMSLRILDDNNQGSSDAAIKAVNYARDMRERYNVNDSGRVTQGAGVRVLNNSWGQPGGFELALQTAIVDSGNAGILFVAAAGNGNFLGQGVDNDRTPFYPASYDSPNVIAVASSTSDSALASSSNFGSQSVDLAAPGTGVRSTERNGGYGTRNGTSMATPHVAGTAALIWSALPVATPEEVRQAILSSVTPAPALAGTVASGGRLSTAAAISANVFAPSAFLVAKQDVTESGGGSTEFTVEYFHRSGIDVSTLGDDDLVVTRSWGASDPIFAELIPGAVTSNATTATATYRINAPGREETFTNSVTTPIDNSLVSRVFSNYLGDEIGSANSNTINSPILVEDVSETIIGFSASIDFDRDRTSDLKATLIAPNGARAILFSDFGNRFDDLEGTTFDDTATVSISNAAAPFTGLFLPVESITPLLGSDPNGEWTLEVVNGVDGEGGTLKGWTLNFLLSNPRTSTIESQIVISDFSEPAFGLTVSIDIDHSSVEDLTATLIAPSGARAMLLSNTGGASGRNFIATTFDDSSQETLADSNAPYTGVFRAEESLSSLTTEDPNGNWSLEVKDGNDNGLAGLLLGWSLSLHGAWDPLDFGNYELSTVADAVRSTAGDAMNARGIGSVEVRIDDPSVFYVNSEEDSVDTNPGDGVALDELGRTTLRAAIQEANAADGERIIILDRGNYNLGIAGQSEDLGVTGDLDITGKITIAGNRRNLTKVDGRRLDRVFDVIGRDSSLSLLRVTVTSGQPSIGESGGAIKTTGKLFVDEAAITRSTAEVGGGVAILDDGVANIQSTVIERNSAMDVGGGLAVGLTPTGCSGLSINRSSIAYNELFSPRGIVDEWFQVTMRLGAAIYAGQQGGLECDPSTDLRISNSTISNNGNDNQGVGGVYLYDDSLEIESSTIVENLGFDLIRDLRTTGRSDLRGSIIGKHRLPFDLPYNGNAGFNIFGQGLGPAKLSPLTRTPKGDLVHVPLPGSRAIDAANHADFPPTDQLGVARGIDAAEFPNAMIGNSQPDIGAVEVAQASLSGTLFHDVNEDGKRGADEPGLSQQIVFLDENQNGVFDPNEPSTITNDDDPNTLFVNEAGTYLLSNVSPGSYETHVISGVGWQVSKSRETELIASVGFGVTSPTVSNDGRYVVFASNQSDQLGFGRSDFTHVFLYDRKFDSVEAISISPTLMLGDGNSTSPAISGDGSVIAFATNATNLIAGETNSVTSIVVYDRKSGKFERLTDEEGEPFTEQSDRPSLSDDGRMVAFQSNGDIFLHDRQSGQIELVSFDDDLELGPSYEPAIAGDGQSVAFISDVVEPDFFSLKSHAYLFDSRNDSLKNLSDDSSGSDPGIVNVSFGEGRIDELAVNQDGRFVLFRRQDVDLGPELDRFDHFLYNNTTDSIAIVHSRTSLSQGDIGTAISDDGRFAVLGSDLDLNIYDLVSDQEQSFGRGNESKVIPTISGDGRFIVFRDLSGINAAPNPFSDVSLAQVELRHGDIVNGFDFALVALPGEIAGRIFLDEFENDVLGVGESPIVGATVFLDVNRNGVLDEDEPAHLTGNDGRYHFSNLESQTEYAIQVNGVVGVEQVFPLEASDQLVFVPAGATVAGRDFGFQRIVATGQSSDSTISGRVISDTNGNGIIDAGDTPATGRVVYLDGGTPGVRDFNDPQTITDVNGNYSFTALPSTLTPVRLLIDNQLVQVSPLGNDLLGNNSQPLKFPLSDKEKSEGNPQSVVTGDFNGDGFADVAVVLGETNKLSIRLNDKQGGFTSQKFDFNLSDFAIELNAANKFSAPISLVTDQLDSNPKLDFAIVGNFTGNVLVLLNFDSATGAFGSTALLPVGHEPIDIVSGQFASDGALDLVVLDKVAGTVQVLANNGSGVFTVGAPVDTGGEVPVSLVVGDFIGSSDLDLVVTHVAPKTTATTSGGVTVLMGDSNGVLSYDGNYYPVQATPLDSAVADFNDDGRPDLAVVNFSSNSISILLGQADGALRVQSTTLGTASGAINVEAADIDNDGDIDVITTKLATRQVSIFRNIGLDSTTGEVRFEPQENIGLGQFQFGEQVPFKLANLDNDTSGPGGSGTLDIVAIPQNTDTLYVLHNRLVQGSRRASVSGAASDIASGIDFLIRSATLPPMFKIQSLPSPIVEDATEQSVIVTGIIKGRVAGPALQFTVMSSNIALVANPTISFADGSSQATVLYTPTANENGTSVLTVRAVDAGADEVHGTSDDGIFEQSFTVTVLAVNDPPTFLIPAETSASQKAGAQSLANFVTGIGNGGNSDESGQTLSPFTVMSDVSYFAVQPAIDATGTLTFTPKSDKSGAIPVTVSLSDDGGVVNGGVDTTTKTFVVSLLPVNDPPTFDLSPSFSVDADAGMQTRISFANNFSPGGGSDEADQTVSDYVVMVDSPGLFSVLPDIDNSGTLTFIPAIDRAGTATVRVQVRDSGGQARGGNDLSETQVFQITIGFVANPSSEIVLESEGETLSLSTLSERILAATKLIDIRGTGKNRILLDGAKIAGLSPNQSLLVIADTDDEVTFDGGWKFDSVEIVDGTFRRIFRNGDAIIRLVGPLAWTNPLLPEDVNGSGLGTAADALTIINALPRRQVTNNLNQLVDPTTLDSNLFQFYDPNGDGFLTALDALYVINRLPLSSGGLGELISTPILISITSSETQNEPSRLVELPVSEKISPAKKLKPVVATNQLPLYASTEIGCETPVDFIGKRDVTFAETFDWLKPMSQG
ncbi:S8 family serine peptidase [Novipirellula sp.]|uniref:S8 family serine peptidase n=1 Tax=Novipirellula sp. TaxID=2795430 RepID=UPI003561E5DB